MIDVLIPNIKRKYSGVTSANRNVAPGIAKQFGARWIGPHKPDGISALGLTEFFGLRLESKKIIWHARRNNEMIIGLLLRLLGWPFIVIFTSAAQRHHTRFTNFLMSQMDFIISTSNKSAYFVPRSSYVIHHGVDIRRYSPRSTSEKNGDNICGGEQIFVGCFGRVRHQKGTDVFVEAMCRLLPDHPNVTAVVIGKIADNQRNFAQSLHQRIEAANLSGRILVLNELPIEEVAAWFRRITIYAFTSRVEGFGLTILEAMAAGNAVVASRAGAAEVVIRDQIDGLLVDPGNVDQLTTAIESLLLSPAKITDYSVAACKRVVDTFNLDQEIEQTATFYRRIKSVPPLPHS